MNSDRTTESGSLIHEIVRAGARGMLAAALEAEVNQYISELAAERDDAARLLAGGRVDASFALASRHWKESGLRYRSGRIVGRARALRGV